MTNDDPRLTKEDIKELLEAVQADREARQVFLSMPREDQLLSILGMIAYVNSQIASIQRDNIDYRHSRETREKDRNQSLQDTGEMIAIGIRKALDERSQRWTKILDNITTSVLTVVILGILYLVFSRGGTP